MNQADRQQTLRQAEEIDTIYPKRVGSPVARIGWIIAAIERDGVRAVRSGTEAFAAACKDAGLCRRHADWGSVPYPMKFFGKKYSYYLLPPEDQLCISKNRVVKRVQPGSPVDTSPCVPMDYANHPDPVMRERYAAWKKREAAKR